MIFLQLLCCCGSCHFLQELQHTGKRGREYKLLQAYKSFEAWFLIECLYEVIEFLLELARCKDRGCPSKARPTARPSSKPAFVKRSVFLLTMRPAPVAAEKEWASDWPQLLSNGRKAPPVPPAPGSVVRKPITPPPPAVKLRRKRNS